MGLATHLGPWLLGTVKTTTGTSAGQIRNTGAANVVQSYIIDRAAGTSGTVCTIPAGSLITELQIVCTTLFNSITTITLSIGSTAITATGGSATTINNLGPAFISYPITSAGTALWNNVGTTDATITYSLTGTATIGKATIIVRYVVRNPDGSIVPTSTTA